MTRSPARQATGLRRRSMEAHILQVLTLELALVVVTQKVAIRLGGEEQQISLAFVIHFAAWAYLAAQGLVFVSAQRLLLLCGFAAVASFASIQYAGQALSLPSLILMLAISTMLVFVVPLSKAAYRNLLNRFVLFGVTAAGLVGLDWAIQLAGLPMPSLDPLIPKDLVYYAYNYIQPVHWGSPWMKPNGLFFLETSHVSQFIGMALVIELGFFRRWIIVAALSAALLGSLGGTGMLLVASSLPFLLARARPLIIVVLLVIAPAGLMAANQIGLLDTMLRRTTEFSEESSSGYNRFVLPVQWSISALTAPPERAWLGSGAGSMPKSLNNDAAGTVGYAWPPFTKVGVEYGTLALLIWLVFLAVSLFGHGTPFIVSWVAFFQYMFLNGSLNVPIHTVYCVLLCSGYLVAQETPSIHRQWKHSSLRSSFRRADLHSPNLVE